MIKRLQLCLVLILGMISIDGFSQTFNGTGGGIPDNGIQTCFPVTVTGLPTALNAANGLTQVCINITHTYDADLDIFLVSPNGGALELVTDVGGANNNFQTTCFTATAGTAVTAGSAPFNGTYRPEGSFANCINVGVNGNGTWYLCITDDSGGDVGTLNSWSVTFGAGGAIGATPGCNLNAIASDVCMGAPSICSLDGYCGNTSTCFSPGQIPSGFCGSVENNGWLSFVASATSATLNITVNNCVNSQGIQMEIYGTSNCQTFTSYSNCWNPGTETNGSVTGNGLTIGQTYYLMIDGYAGDNCDYVINPGSGILTVNVTPATTTICSGSSTTLTANATGATGYSWAPGGQTTQSITVSPGSTTTYTCTIAGTCGGGATATSTVTVNTAATVGAGADQSICSGSTVTMAGSFGGGATSATWSTSGSGTFTSTTAANAVYTPSATDISSGTVTITYTTNDPAGPCPAVSDAMVLTISPAATVNAGTDQTICSGTAVTLGATRGGGATSSTWTSSGTGTFSNTTILNPTYTPSAADISAGTVTLTITTNDPAGPCPAVSDAMVVTINIQASANAGPNQTICAGSTVTLTGTRGGSATSSTWTTSGSGTFANATATSTTYTPSAADISAGTVTLTITTNDPAGPCPAATSSLVVTINPGATASAGGNQTICAGSTVTLTGSRGGAATSSTWTSSGSGSFGNASLVNTTYTPSAADISAGTVTLTITTNDPAGPCPAATSSLVLTINPVATANAGVNGAICAGSTYTLAGSIGGGASSLTWTTSGSGSFSNSTATNPTYTPSASDISAGSVTLTITTNDPAGPCPAATASMVLTINPGATASAGPAATICGGTTYSLPGSIGGSASSVTWTSSGSGSFSSTTSVTPTYTPSAGDISAGTVTLTMTTNDPAGPCPAAVSSMILTISPAATANAGADATICANQTYTLNGSRGGAATSSTWTTSGSGTFSNASAVNPVYTPSASDISAGSVTLTITTNDPAGPCPAVSDAMVLTITPLQNASFTFGSATYCQTGANPTPTITGVAGGTFTFTPAGLSINASTGLINLAASTLGTYSITYTTPGPCANTSSVNVTITLAPIATFSYAGPYCSTDANPSPTFGGGATAGTFSSTAGLVFVNVNTGQVNLSASTPGTYTVTNAIAASGGCAPASATATITINQAATANAGSAATICAGSTYTLAGVIGGSASSLTWTSSGTGSFSSATVANATYTPSAADISAGSVTLTITTNDPAGACPPVTSSMVLTINPAATAAAGSAATICAGSTYTLAGVIGGSATSGTWSSSGSGSFNNTSLLGATYTPSAADVSAGSVTLTLTTNDPAGPCPAVTSSLVLTINPAATATAGANSTICSGSTYTLAGSIGGGATSSTWTTTGSGTFSNATALNATYTPSAADISAGSVILTLTTNDPAGPCTAATSTLTLTISPAATVSAGSAATICSGSTYTLAGTMGGGASSITWTTSGTGTFNNTASTTATYTPSAADIAAGTVTLTITSNDPVGPCPAATANMVLTINPAATVTAGSNATICGGTTYALNGTMGGGATSITWTTSGSGTFSNANSTTAVYTPSATDIANGNVTLTITSNDPAGPCPAAVDQFTLTINPAAVVTAGANATICAGSTYTLAGTLGGSTTTVTWTSSGTGTFSNPNITTPTYTPSAADIAAGTVTLTITSNDPVGPCPVVTSTMTITINPAATVSAGGNATICSSSTYTLAGTMGGSATSVTWTTTGSGSFSSSTSLTPIYTPSAADIAAGSVSITITTNDPAGPCPAATDVMTLTINPAATVNAGPDATICSNLSASLTGAFGGSTSSILWSSSGTGTFGSTTSPVTTYNPSAADIAAGTVTLTITSNDPAGVCGVVTDNMVLTINLQDNASFTYPGSTFCQTGTDPVATLAGAVSGTFTATPAGLVFLDNTTGLIDVSASTLGNYFITFTSNGICPNNSTISVTLTAAPDATFSYGTPFCQTGTTTPTFPVGASAGTFTASPAGIVFTNPSTGQIDLAASAPGTYTITNTIAASAGCAPAVATSTIVIDPIATVNAGVDGSVCEASTFALTGVMGGSATAVTWTTSGTGTFSNATSLTGTYSPSAADVAAGTVTLTITTDDPTGVCTQAVDNLVLLITPLDDASFTYPGSTYCQTGTDPVATITGLAGGTFTASPAGAVINASTGLIDLSASTLGTYTVTYTTNGVCPNTATASVTITTAPSAAFTYATPFCQTGTNPLPSFTVGASAGAFTSTSGLTINGSTGEVDLANSTPGTYTITNTIVAAGGCAQAVDSTQITINQAATVLAGNDTSICAGASLTFNGSSIGGSATSSTWTTSGTGVFDNSGLLNATYTPSTADTTAGVVTLYITTNDPAGACGSVMDSLVLTINPIATAPLVTNPAAYCAGASINPITAGSSGGTINWYSDAGLTTLVSTGNPLTPTGITGTTTFWVTETVGPCVSASGQVTITINPLPVLDTTTITVTSADCGTSTGSITGIVLVSGQPTVNYYWTNAIGDTVGTTIDLTNVGPGSYTLTVLDGNNCSTQITSSQFNVTSTNAVVASFTASPNTGETPLLVQFTNGSTGSTNYVWDFGTGLPSTLTDPTFTYNQTGTFTVCLFADNGLGCADTACSTIDVYINSVFVIPNVFSPNDDGTNDIFGVQNKGLETMDAEIYNRWGLKEYEWHTTNGGWDGRTASGVPAPDGTYYYIISAKGFDGKEYFKKGSFTLVR